jgi:hypothetical protein
MAVSTKITDFWDVTSNNFVDTKSSEEYSTLKMEVADCPKYL